MFPISTLLIVSSDSEFAANVMSRWQWQPTAFITLGDGSAPDGVLSACDLAICGQASLDSLVAILRSLYAAGRPAICLAPDPKAATILRQAHARALIVVQQEGAVENLVLLAGEMLRSSCSSSSAREEAHIEAALGRFMLDMRHRMNNALTSILGNSELLLLDGDTLSAQVREQVGIMHEMALRIHETILQFTALEQSMKVAVTVPPGGIELSPRTMLHASPAIPGEQPAASGTGMS